jgi:transcriptional regulator with XRE-family HTH domain
MGIEIVFGKILSELRAASGLSQQKLADASDLERTFISLLERGKRQPTITTLFNLSKALGISPHDMVLRIETEMAMEKSKKSG